MKDSFLRSNTNIISKPDLRIGPGYISYFTVTLAGGMTVHQDKCALFVIRPYSAAMRSGSFRSRAEMRMHVSSEMPNAGGLSHFISS